MFYFLNEFYNNKKYYENIFDYQKENISSKLNIILELRLANNFNIMVF